MSTREQKSRRFTADDAIWWAAVGVAAVAGLFSLIVSILLIANYLEVRAITPLDDPDLLKLRAQFAAAPETDPALILKIRSLDLLDRKAFFTSQAHLKMGGGLLMAGVIILLAALRVAARFRPRLPVPEGEGPAAAYWISRRRARKLVALTGGVWVAAALFAAYLTKLDLPAPIQQAETATTVPVATYPDWDTMQRNWPTFRGPGAYGVAYYKTAPTEWDLETGKNVKWKTAVPLPGANSPVVWDNRVFLTGATEDASEVYCFDSETGQLLWRRALDKLPGTPAKPPKVGDDTGFAAPSMAAHGDRVLAIFANGDLACYDFGGNLKWGKNLGMPDNHYGHASSLMAYQNMVFVQYDQRSNGKLLALDVADGHEVWSVNREKISWASPACVPTPFGVELVLNSERNVDAYDPLTGKLAWKLKCLDGEVAPSPAYSDGVFFVANDNAIATAIRFRPDDKTPQPEIAWQWDEALPDVSSPVGVGQHFYVATSRGEIVCLDAATGKPAWTHEFDEGFYASPIVVADRIYALDKKGTAYVFKTGPAFELIATSRLNEAALATPAFMDGRIYFRTETQLICIAKQNEPGT